MHIIFSAQHRGRSFGDPAVLPCGWGCALAFEPIVRPRSAINATRPLRQLPKASDSGAFDPVPSAFILTNAGDSLSCSRIQRDTASKSTERRNGMRQLQSAKAASPVVERVIRMTSRDTWRRRIVLEDDRMSYASASLSLLRTPR